MKDPEYVCSKCSRARPWYAPMYCTLGHPLAPFRRKTVIDKLMHPFTIAAMLVIGLILNGGFS